MEVLYLLIPLSAVLVLAIIGVFGWALQRGQFEDLEREGWRILDPAADDGAATRSLDGAQVGAAEGGEQSSATSLDRAQRAEGF
jgi:cbb3-type cytochrome oxidase maturation protein